MSELYGKPVSYGLPISGGMSIVITLALVVALYYGRDIFIPLALAILLTFVLAPIVRWMRFWRLGHVPPVILAVILAFSIIFGLGAILGQQVADLAQRLPQYQITISNKVHAVRVAIGNSAALRQLSGLLQEFNREVGAPPNAPQLNESQSRARQEPIPVEVHQPEPGPLQVIERIMNPLLAPLATTGIVVIFVFFFLLEREDLRDRLIRLAGYDIQRTTAAMNEVANRLSRYFLAQLGLNALFGVLITSGLSLIGIPNPILWGILGMILRFVPYIGAFLSAVFPLALALAVDPGWSMIVWTFALFLAIEPLIGQVMEPMVYGHSTGLSPVAVVFAATFWTWLWGPIGLLLSTPITVCLVVLGRHVESFRFFDILFGDRPALTPAQSFYQRTLAGDPDEPTEQAEQFLREKPLFAYYDEIVIQGLTLAEIDIRRGVLDEKQIAHIRQAVHGLIEELSHDEGKSTKDKERGEYPAIPTLRPEDLAPEWSHTAPLLCVSGRGAFDDLFGECLVQLLKKHGIGSRFEVDSAVSSSNIIRLRDEGIQMVCMSYLDVSHTQPHLRYAIRRLRRKLPAAKIIACLWGQERRNISEETLREEIGADFCVTDFEQALTLVIHTAQSVASESRAMSERERIGGHFDVKRG
jgi:predicted PurR-regulated permease PerM